MRTLSATLQQAQKSASVTPYVKVEVLDSIAGVARPVMQHLYTGNEPDFYHHAAMPGEGSLVRARIDPGANSLYVQRVASPGPGSNFSVWTYLNAVGPKGIALASRGANVMLFYVGTEGRTIYRRRSTDYGATWDPPETVITPAVNAVEYVAAGIDPQGYVALFYASDNGVVYVTRNTTGSWGNPSAWPHQVGSITGMDCAYQGDFNLVVAGQDSAGNRKVWTCIYGDGASQATGTWSPLMELATASSDSSIQFQRPFLGRPDLFRLCFVEKYTGAFSYARPHWSHSLAAAAFLDNLWREPVPFNASCEYGVAITGSASCLWLSTPFGVWQGTLGTVSLDVSADVLEVRLAEEPRQSRVLIALRNADGRYVSPGTGALAAIKRGSEVRIGLGYRTSQGDEASQGPSLWIEGWEHASADGKALFMLHAAGPWDLLQQWRARRQYSWTLGQKSVYEILAVVLARAGLALTSISTSSTMTTHKPAFTIHPGENGRQVTERLLDLVPDALFFRGAQGVVKNPQDTDATDYAYGTDHAILEGRYGRTAQGVNRAQVYGSAGMAEAFEWPEIDHLYDRLQQVHDLNLDSAAKVQERGQTVLRQALMKATSDEIAAPPNCGQELYDVVEITDARAGLQMARRRVTGLRLELVRSKKPLYRQVITLGGV